MGLADYQLIYDPHTSGTNNHKLLKFSDFDDVENFMPNSGYNYRFPVIVTDGGVITYYTMFKYAWDIPVSNGTTYPFFYMLGDTYGTLVNGTFHNYISNNTFPPTVDSVRENNRICKSNIDCLTNNGLFDWGTDYWNLPYAASNFRFKINLTSAIGSMFGVIDKFYFFIETDDLPYSYQLADITNYDAYYYYDEAYPIDYCQTFLDVNMWGSTGAMHNYTINIRYPFSKSRNSFPMRVLMFFKPRWYLNGTASQDYIDIPCLCNGANPSYAQTVDMRFHKIYIKFNQYMINGRNVSDFHDMSWIEQGYGRLFDIYKDESQPVYNGTGNIGSYDLTLGQNNTI